MEGSLYMLQKDPNPWEKIDINRLTSKYIVFQVAVSAIGKINRSGRVSMVYIVPAKTFL